MATSRTGRRRINLTATSWISMSWKGYKLIHYFTFLRCITWTCRKLPKRFVSFEAFHDVRLQNVAESWLFNFFRHSATLFEVHQGKLTQKWNVFIFCNVGVLERRRKVTKKHNVSPFRNLCQRDVVESRQRNVAFQVSATCVRGTSWKGKHNKFVFPLSATWNGRRREKSKH